VGRADIGIVGSGRVAQAMGRLLCESGQPVRAIAGRTPINVRRAAAFVANGCRAVESIAIDELPRFATRVLIAVSDSGLAEVAEILVRAGFTRGTALHTCGARGPDVLEPLRHAGVHCGVIHPLQTIVSAEQGSRDLEQISFALAGDAGAVAWGREIIAAASGREIAVSPGGMATYHAGAVLASNAVAALLDSAVRLMSLAGIDDQDVLDGLGPLTRTSVENALRLGPRAALTGPIARGDIQTVRAHVQALSSATDSIRELYRAAGFVLVDLARQRGGTDHLQEIAAELNQLEKCHDR
jgi:predicted short-subunit dehydrogenase-like oxidoreductase (DUF2520 family)